MGGTAMIFAPARLGSVTLDNETLATDKKGCRRFGRAASADARSI